MTFFFFPYFKSIFITNVEIACIEVRNNAYLWQKRD